MKIEEHTEIAAPQRLGAYFAQLAARPAWRWSGRVVEANGQTVESEGPLCSVGECCEILDGEERWHRAEVIGFRGRHVLAMPLEATQGIRYGNTVMAMGITPAIAVGEEMEGRILNALGMPLDGMTRNTAADLTVVGLVGERGREVREFVEDSLGEEGRQRSVVLVSTSDQSPLLRMRAAMAATAVAEFYAARGKHVLLVLDSLTRYAMAAREIGLAAGEPPASKGYTPSVFARLAKLVERAGNFQNGSITAFYTVLMEGDDQQDPVVDAVRSLLDGHVVLSRSMAAGGWYPPVDILDSLSRLMPAVTTSEHRAQATTARRLLAAHARSEDLIRIGAYRAGTDEVLDRAIRAMPVLREFLEQGSRERVTMDQTIARMNSMEL